MDIIFLMGNVQINWIDPKLTCAVKTAYLRHNVAAEMKTIMLAAMLLNTKMFNEQKKCV